MRDLRAYLETQRRRVDDALDRFLPPETERPAGLHQAMRYSLFSGGKRLRPILCLGCAEAAGAEDGCAMAPAAALECLHTYSLIHDDLPAMDDDDLRRGRPASHVAFGEANAILAGDSLLTLAFELLGRCRVPPPYDPGALVLELARASGSRGMAGGQYEDIAAEHGEAGEDLVRFIHENKTGKLITAACRMGAIAAGADGDQLAAVTRYGQGVGLAFQIADDILNVTAHPDELGKAVGSDAERGKLTFVAVYGLEQAGAEARRLVEAAAAELAALPGRTEPLEQIARYIVERRT